MKWFDHDDDALILLTMSRSSISFFTRIHGEQFTGTNRVKRLACDLGDVLFLEQDDELWDAYPDNEVDDDEEDQDTSDDESDAPSNVLLQIYYTYPNLREITFVVGSADGPDWSDKTMTKFTDMDKFYGKANYEAYAKAILNIYKEKGGVDLDIRFVNM